MLFIFFFLCGCLFVGALTDAVREYIRSVACFRRLRAARKHTVIW